MENFGADGAVDWNSGGPTFRVNVCYGEAANRLPFAFHRPHPGSEPPGPEHCYKDGISPQCGGASFTALKHTAPNSGAPWSTSIYDATVDTDAVVVENVSADDFQPASLVISAKFQCGWYQYVHSWEFDAYGADFILTLQWVACLILSLQ